MALDHHFGAEIVREIVGDVRLDRVENRRCGIVGDGYLVDVSIARLIRQYH